MRDLKNRVQHLLNFSFILPQCVSPAPCNSFPGCSEPGPGSSWSNLGVLEGPAGAGGPLEFWMWQCQPCRPWYAVSELQPGLSTEKLWISYPFLFHHLSQTCHAHDVQPLVQVWRGEPSTRPKKTLVMIGALLWRVFEIVCCHLAQVMQTWSLWFHLQVQ